MNTLVFDESPYKNVVCLAHIVDRDGQKMSKSRGNVIDPWTILDSRGADALRWYFFSAGSPWTNRRVDEQMIDESTRSFLITLWSTAYFFVTYANLDAWEPGAASTPDHVLDRWARSRLHATVRDVTEALDRFDALRAAQALESLVDDLSNWYVRRSRPRFWKAADASAHATLHECLETLTLCSRRSVRSSPTSSMPRSPRRWSRSTLPTGQSPTLRRSIRHSTNRWH